MKTFKVIVFMIVASLAIVSCRKSDLKPTCNHSNTETQSTTTTGKSSNRTANSDGSGDNSGTTVTVSGTIDNGIYGGGDDDRDGGDKKHKKLQN
ncbi:MAG: hypothetical protein JST26_03155 [Bacteroidetes bacterium]|nr:hypothetical protein [Bacteroidota bacterium]